MRRHLIGIGLAIVMVLVMFFAGAWGYVRLLRLPTQAGAPLSAMPAQGGSLLSNGNVLTALGAVAGTAILAGILIAVPRISAFAAGLPGLFAIAWQAVYLVSVHRAVEIIPLRGHAFGAGWEALLFNGILGTVGLAMIIPLFLPSRWRGRPRNAEVEEADVTEASDYMADLKESAGSGASTRTLAGVGAAPRGGPAAGRVSGAARPAAGTGPIPAAGTGPRPGAGTGPRPAAGTGPRPARGAAPTSANPIQGKVTPRRSARTGLVTGPQQVPPTTAMRPRPYRRPADDA
ncbi:MAG TPA: hypothetical protein VF060_09180 [Trebonia sp.]